MQDVLPYADWLYESWKAACEKEHVFGSKMQTARRLFGSAAPEHRFFLASSSGGSGALYLHCGELLIAGDEAFDPSALFNWLSVQGVTQVNGRLEICRRLQAKMGGELESSYFMRYPFSRPPLAEGAGLETARTLEDCFRVLCQSHEYYRAHLRYEPWAEELSRKLESGLGQLAMIYEDGKPVATGSIASEDEQTAVLAAIAVIPSARGRGLGRRISAGLTARVLEMGKQPMLISGYDAVAELYRGLGYEECGRWGELCLSSGVLSGTRLPDGG